MRDAFKRSDLFYVALGLVCLIAFFQYGPPIDGPATAARVLSNMFGSTP